MDSTGSEDILENEKKYIEIETFDLLQCLGSKDQKIKEICRICLSIDSNELVSLVSTKEGTVLGDMFVSLTSIQVYPDEGLPLQVCVRCKAQVEKCYEFKVKCERSDCILRSVLKEELKPKDEPDDCENNQRAVNNNITSENNVKEEVDFIEDIEYLEENDASEDEALCIVQKLGKKKKNELDIIITDSNSLLQEVVSAKKLSKKRENNKSFECDYCSKRFLRVKTLSAHIKRKHETPKFPHACSQCKESFTSEHDLRLHMALHSKGAVWKCNKCHKEFNARSVLRRHINRHMECKRYSCERCGKPFAELYALRRHLRVHTGERPERNHACHLCDKRYSDSGQLAAHLRRHSGARPCLCACGKAFPSARLLASHRRVHTDRKPYACDYCDKRFRHESTRNTHHRTHTGEKPYVCSTCGKTFIQNSNLTLHMRTHTGERPYSCEMCDRKFTSGSSLKCHLRTHTGEKPYSCDVCGKRFARMDMSAHMRQHTGERPFACNLCSKKFPSASRLRDHYRIHTGEKPFECAMCTQKFATKSHLVKHLKTHETKKKKIEKRDVVVLQQVDYDRSYILDKFVITKNKESCDAINSDDNDGKTPVGDEAKNVTVEMPLEVAGNLVIHDENDINTEVLVVDDGQSDVKNYENGNICLSTGAVNFVNNDLNYGNDVNLVTVNEGEMSISASSAMLEGATVKLYQLDQSLLQIHSSGGQVTISKITSKMTANF